MAPVADLIEQSFDRELDSKSRRMVRDMRTFGRAGWIGWLLGHLFLPPAAYPQGYVWQEGEDLVGNASLLPAFEGSSRWVLANVAVHPAHRRRGIARRLVQACLELAWEQGANEVVLQVRSDNEAAMSLYHSLNFDVLSERSTWVRSGRLEAPDPGGAPVRQRRRDEWRRQWALARQLFPEGLYWPYPLRRSWFEPSGWERFLSLRQRRHWVLVDESDEFRASLTARFSRDSGGWRLAVLVPQIERGELEGPLLRRGVHDLQATGVGLSLSYPTGLVDDLLTDLHFRRRRTLTWMGRQVTLPSQGADASGPPLS